MSEVVRVAIVDGAMRVQWPPRCPACGAEGRLVPSTNRVSQVKSMRPGLGSVTVHSQVLHVSVPMCEKHAGTNSTANFILERSLLMSSLRWLSYVGAFFLVEMLVGLVINPGSWQRLLDMGVFLMFPAFSLGCLAIWWARKNTFVWPKRFDPDVEVLEIQFADERYARHFKRANRDATDTLATAAPPWYMRSITWKLGVLAVFVMWMMHVARH